MKFVDFDSGYQNGQDAVNASGDRDPVDVAVSKFTDEVMSDVDDYLAGFRKGYAEALAEALIEDAADAEAETH